MMKAKVCGWFSLRGAAEGKTSDKMWLHVLCAAVLSFLPVLYYRDFYWHDTRYAFIGLAAYLVMKFYSRTWVYHPVIVYSLVWMGAVLAVFINLTIMPFFWLLGYYLATVGWFLPKTEFIRCNPKCTDEYVSKQMRLCLILRPIFVVLGVVLFAIGPSFSF